MPRRRIRKRYILLALIAIGALTGWYLFRQGLLDPASILAMIHAYPLMGPLVFIAVFSFSIMCILPVGLPFNLGAGIIWGTVMGGFLTILATAIASAISFLLARYLIQDLLLLWVKRRGRLWMLDAIEQHDWQLLFITRINPIMPFGVMNYLFGLTTISFRRYMMVTVLANVPLAFAFCAVGQALSDIALTADMESALINIGIALLIVTIFYTGKILLKARQAG